MAFVESKYNRLLEEDDICTIIQASNSIKELMNYIKEAERLKQNNPETNISFDSAYIRATALLWERALTLDETSTYDNLNEVLVFCKDLVSCSYPVSGSLHYVLDLILDIIQEKTQDFNKVQKNHEVLENIKGIIAYIDYPNRNTVQEINEILNKIEPYRPENLLIQDTENMKIDFKLLQIPSEENKKIERLFQGREFVKGFYNNQKAGIKVYNLNGISKDKLNEINTEVSCLNIHGKSKHKSFINYLGEYLDHEKNNLYLVMELGEKNLDEYIQTNGPFNLQEFLDFAYIILTGLNTMKAKNHYHGDLKPENIVIDSNGAPKIIDFSASSIRVSTTDKTLSKNIHYTRGYAAPELLEWLATGDIPSDIQPISRMKIDVYSLGITFLKMLLGKDFKMLEPTKALLDVSLKKVINNHKLASEEKDLEKIMKFLPGMVEIKPKDRFDLNRILACFSEELAVEVTK